MTTRLQDTHAEDGPDCVRVGEVTAWDGRVLTCVQVLQRRWGWPRKAATAAADVLQYRDATPIIWVKGKRRTAQQRKILNDHPEILDHLIAGLARGSSKERWSDKPLKGVVVSLDEPRDDDGFVTGVLDLLADTHGCSTHDVRERCEFDTTTDAVFVRFKNRGMRS